MEATAERQEVEFNYQVGDCLLVPYLGPENPHFPDLTLARIFQRMHDDGIYSLCFHDVPTTPLTSFLGFMSSPQVRLCLFCTMDGEDARDVCGLAWLSDLEALADGRIVRATASIGFFRSYWEPKYTDVFGRLALNWWFKVLGITVITAMTPSMNRASVRYIKRMGMKELGRIPGYTLFDDEPCDGVVAYLTADDFFRGGL